MPSKEIQTWIEYNYSIFPITPTVRSNMSVYTTGRYLQTSRSYLILLWAVFACSSFLLFRLRKSYISSTTFALIFIKLYIVFLLVYFQPFRSQNRDHGNMASIQRCDCGELASGFYCIWRPSRTVSNSTHTILSLETATSAGS